MWIPPQAFPPPCPPGRSATTTAAGAWNLLNEAVQHSGLDRCPRRHGVSDLKALLPQEDLPKPEVDVVKDDAPGFVHADVKLPTDNGKALPRAAMPKL